MKFLSDGVWFLVLNLKVAFFCLPLAESSQEILAFECKNPKTERKSQLTWTVLPQGFKDSSTIFGEELETWIQPPGEGTLLQYIDDLLVATRTQENGKAWTVSLLNFLELSEYRVHPEKAQLILQ